MKPIRLVLAAIFALHGLSLEVSPSNSSVVLPNPDLIRCSTPWCPQVWNAAGVRDAIYPHHVTMDFNRGCVYGVTAYYDASVPFEAVKSAIDESYKQWRRPIESGRPADLAWRVAPMRLTIDLGATDQHDMESFQEEIGAPRVVYLAYDGKLACERR